MNNLRNNEKELNIKLNTEELSPTQVRLLKSINSLLIHVMTADEEAEYFESSAELIRKTAEAVKHASFSEKNKKMDYGTQAVEYAMDFLNETLEENNLRNIDN
jgi:hypothetical protein